MQRACLRPPSLPPQPGLAWPAWRQQTREVSLQAAADAGRGSVKVCQAGRDGLSNASVYIMIKGHYGGHN